MNHLTIITPDDWHLHLRDTPYLEAVVGDSARQFGRAIVMPNLVPPVRNCDDALAYRERCSTLGRDVRVSLADGTSVDGRARDVDGSGRLVLDTAGGPRTFGAGDVVHLR